jgi:hypothetical protein
MTEIQFKKLKDLDPRLQTILRPYVNPFVYSETQDEKEQIYDKACKESLLSKKEVYNILKNERREIQHKHVRKMAKLQLSDNQAFITKYNIREKIPEERLPCVFGINMFGKVKYSDNLLSLSSTKDLQFLSKIDKDYVCSGWRC